MLDWEIFQSLAIIHKRGGQQINSRKSLAIHFVTYQRPCAPSHMTKRPFDDDFVAFLRLMRREDCPRTEKLKMAFVVITFWHQGQGPFWDQQV